MIGASAMEGNTASSGFPRNIPQEYLSLWEIGEETGELEKTVDKISEISGDKAELLLTELARWLPIIIYFMTFFICYYYW